MVKIKEIKNYWEKNTPQYWYSNKRKDTKEYYDEIQKIRYSFAYPYLINLAEFDKHQNEKVLEIGCGQGTDLLQFAKGGAKVTGIDLTESAISKTKNMFEVYNYKINLKVANVEKLSCFEDDYFDVAYSFGVLHHTPNTQKAINEIWRVLKVNGKAIIMIYAKGFNYLFCKFLYFHILRGDFLRHNFQETINLHSEYKRYCPLTKMYSKKQAQKLFSRFKEIQIIKLHNPQIKDKVPQVIYKYFQKIFGDNLFIKCVK
jgi:ubiquinone/menaquinone biosynthesis C-methylase UbiE